MADAAAGGASPQSEGSEAGGEWTKVGAGGRPVKAAAPSGAHAPSPDESEERGRLAGGKTADAASRAANAPGGAGTGKRASPKRQEQSPVRTGLDEKLSAIGQQLERLLADQSKICQRLDSVESREAQHVAARSDFDEWRNGKSMHASTRDASGDSDSGYSSDRSDVTRSSLASFDSSGDGEGEKEYLVVQPTNPHWNAKSLSHDDQQEPHLYPLHGYQTYDDLRASRAGADGLLGKGMRYLMPIALYSKTGVDGLRDTIRQLDLVLEGVDRDAYNALKDVRDDFIASYNTLLSAYGLTNRRFHRRRYRRRHSLVRQRRAEHHVYPRRCLPYGAHHRCSSAGRPRCSACRSHLHASRRTSRRAARHRPRAALPRLGRISISLMSVKKTHPAGQVRELC